jgi:predicted MFS family arabinose efflux permease
LIGTILGGLLIGLAMGPWLVGALGVLLSVAGLVASWFIPPAPGTAGVRIRGNIAAATWRVLVAARENAPVWKAVLGLSWFWALGATYLALFPVLVRDVFHADNRVVTLLLAGFALGVGLGAMLGSRLLRGAVSFRLVAPSCAVLSLCTIGFALLSGTGAAARWTTPEAMLGSASGLAAWLLLLGAAMAGGVFSLPLNTMIQRRAAADERSRMVAANNVMNAVYMVAGAGVIGVLSAWGIGPEAMLVGAGVLNLAVAWWFRSEH